MTPRLVSHLSLCAALAFASVVGMRAHQTPQGQAGAPGQGRGGGRGAGAPGAATPAAPAPDPLPASAFSLVAHPEFYLGKVVTISGSLERQLSKTVFTVSQNQTPAQGEVLVLAPTIVVTPSAHAYLTVVGEAFAYDTAEVTRRNKGTAIDVPAAVAEQFKGKPAVIATAIVANDGFVDLTKRPAAPMTPDDEKLSPLMKTIQPALAALRSAATATDATTARAKAAELKKAFSDALPVFKGRNFADAQTWTADALAAINAADAAAATARWADVTAAATTLQGTCTSCHAAHRDRQDDGTFRIK